MTAEGRAGLGRDLPAALALARAGDEEGFRVLFRAIQPPLLRYLYVLVGPDAEDVASDTWLHIVRDLHTFDGEIGDFRRWTATVGRHRAIDHLRHSRRRPKRASAIGALDDWPDQDDTADSAIENVMTGACLTLIARLPREQAEAVMLRVVVGLDSESAGRVLNRRAGAVRTAAYRGLRKLAYLVRRNDPAVLTPENA